MYQVLFSSLDKSFSDKRTSYNAFRNNTMRREQSFEWHSGFKGDQTSVADILNARLTHLSRQTDDNWKRCIKSSLRVPVILHFKELLSLGLKENSIIILSSNLLYNVNILMLIKIFSLELS